MIIHLRAKKLSVTRLSGRVVPLGFHCQPDPTWNCFGRGSLHEDTDRIRLAHGRVCGELSQLLVGVRGPGPPWVVATPEQVVPGFMRKLSEQDGCWPVCSVPLVSTFHSHPQVPLLTFRCDGLLPETNPSLPSSFWSWCLSQQ